MRVFNLLVMDERVEGTPPVFSAPEFNDVLGAVDQLALLVVADQVSGSGTFSYELTVQESADNVLWIAKNGLQGFGDLKPELATGQTSIEVHRDAGTKPSLAFVRVVVTMSQSDAKARIRVWATGRAFAERAFSAAGECA